MNITYWICVLLINAFSIFSLVEGLKDYDKAVLSIIFGGFVVLLPFIGQITWTAILGWGKLGIAGLIAPAILVLLAISKMVN